MGSEMCIRDRLNRALSLLRACAAFTATALPSLGTYLHAGVFSTAFSLREPAVILVTACVRRKRQRHEDMFIALEEEELGAAPKVEFCERAFDPLLEPTLMLPASNPEWHEYEFDPLCV